MNCSSPLCEMLSFDQSLSCGTSDKVHIVWTLFFFFFVFQSLAPQRLVYSPDTPVGDAAKLYWHFHRTDQSGGAGVIIALFLYAVLFLLSITILFIYLLRWDTGI